MHAVPQSHIFAAVKAMNEEGKHWAQRPLCSLCCSHRRKTTSLHHALEKETSTHLPPPKPASFGASKAARCPFCKYRRRRHVNKTNISKGKHLQEEKGRQIHSTASLPQKLLQPFSASVCNQIKYKTLSTCTSKPAAFTQRNRHLSTINNSQTFPFALMQHLQADMSLEEDQNKTIFQKGRPSRPTYKNENNARLFYLQNQGSALGVETRWELTWWLQLSGTDTSVYPSGCMSHLAKPREEPFTPRIQWCVRIHLFRTAAWLLTWALFLILSQLG